MVKELSVFFPAYNEEKNIGPVVERAIQVLNNLSLQKAEILIINDGSTDKTAAAAAALEKKYPGLVRLINHPENQGYGAALRTGFYNARYEWVVFTDADGQFDFSEITAFLKKQSETGADAVVGYYRERKVPWSRKLNTFLWDSLMKMIFGINIRDIDCAFKLIRREVFNKIDNLESERGAFISTELLAKISKKGFKIVETGITHQPRLAGHGTGADLKVIVKSFLDLFRLWRKMR